MKAILLLLLVLLFCDVESFKLKNVFKKAGRGLKTFAKETWRGLKNGPHQSIQRNVPSWSGENVIRAEYATRPLEGNIMKHMPANHHGVVLHTKDGHKWLLHNTLDSGVVITDAKHMSSKWSTHNIPVNGHKTVGEALRSVGSSSIGQEKTGYVKGKTCIGTAHKVEEYLKQ